MSATVTTLRHLKPGKAPKLLQPAKSSRVRGRIRRQAMASAAVGAKPPIWNGAEPTAQCWIDRATWLISRARDGRDIRDAIAETNRYSGRR